MTLAAIIATASSHKTTTKHMKTLAGSSESFQEDRSIDAIHKEQEREFCNNCETPEEQMSGLKVHPQHEIANLRDITRYVTLRKVDQTALRRVNKDT